MASSVRKYLTAILFEYETQKVIAISSYKIGLIYRSIQILIVAYVIGWVMIKEKGYQSFDSVVGGVTTRMKGLDYTNYTNISSIGDRVWDIADWPEQSEISNGFFAPTNVIVTRNQTHATCPEDSDNKWRAGCKVDVDCLKGRVHPFGWGVSTGRCVNSVNEGSTKVCEIYGWCPPERSALPLGNDKVLMTRTENVTVLIINSVEFPRFGVKRTNILSSMSSKYLRLCHYTQNHPSDRYCPVFRLGDIIKYAQPGAKAVNKQIWITGGLVAIDIRWDCNFDRPEDECKPEYKFRDLQEGGVSRSNYFRQVHYYMENGILRRTLMKFYGIKFFVFVSGRGGKFNLATFTMNLGSTLALLTVAAFLCDFIVLNILPKRKQYRQAKMEKVEDRQMEISRSAHENSQDLMELGK